MSITIFAISSILDVWQDSQFTYEYSEYFIQRNKWKNLITYSPPFNSSAQWEGTYEGHNERERMGNTMKGNVWGTQWERTYGGHNERERMGNTTKGNIWGD